MRRYLRYILSSCLCLSVWLLFYCTATTVDWNYFWNWPQRKECLSFVWRFCLAQTHILCHASMYVFNVSKYCIIHLLISTIIIIWYYINTLLLYSALLCSATHMKLILAPQNTYALVYRLVAAEVVSIRVRMSAWNSYTNRSFDVALNTNEPILADFPSKVFYQ